MNLKGEFSILLRGEKDRRTPMKSLNEDIKTGNFKPVYLLYGEEAYLKKQYRDRITKAIFPDGDTVNYAYYEGKGINPGELIDLAETMPFFAKRRLIVVENSGFFKNATPDLADYIKTMPDTACFLFVENEADKRGKMYKAVKSKGRVVEMARQDEKTLLYWVAGNVKKEGYKIKEQTARYLLSTTGTDMENLEKELEKLFCYCMGKEEIEISDIEAICTTQITNKIFDMVKRIRPQIKAALAVMTYMNPIFVYGTDAFMAKCEECGISAVIVPDVPFEEKAELQPYCDKHGVELVSLIAPTSHDRIKTIAKEAQGFVYCVSSMGVTGVRKEITTNIGEMVDLVRSVSDTPCAVGFGISTPEQAKHMSQYADGVIVGSAIVKIVAKYGKECVEPVCEYVKQMKEAMQ